MMYWQNGHMDAGWGIAMMVIMLAFWLLVGFTIARVVRTQRPADLTPAVPETPTVAAERILAERLARGDLEAEDYRTRLAALTPR